MKKSVKKFGDMQQMKPFIHQFALGTVAMAMVQIANAAVAITNVVPLQIPGQGTEIRVMFNGLPPQPQAYQVDQPSRLILDFDKAAQMLKQSSIPVSTTEASSVDLEADAQRARLTVNLKKAGAFTTRVEGNTFILKINNAATPQVENVAPVIMPPSQGVSRVDFHRGGKGEGQVVIDLSNPNTPVDVKQQGNKIVVRFLGNKIPTALARRLNVNDFSTPVSSVDAFNEGRNGVVNIQANGSFDYMAYQTDNRLIISVAKKETIAANNQPHSGHKYTGKKISLDFQDIEVRRVLQLLADFTGVNIVASDSVQGNITLRLKDVPWDQALDIIMKSKNLDKRKNGNVIWVAPVPELLKSEEDAAKAYAQSVKLAPLQTETMQLNYVKAADVKKMIDDADSKNGAKSSSDGTHSSLLSDRGSIIIDIRTNTVIMSDTAEKIEQLKNIIKQIDLPVKQVMIEARVVRATTSFSKSIGVKWGFLSNNSMSVASNTDNIGAMSPLYKSLGLTSASTNNLNVDLGASSSSTGSSPASIAFGLINTADSLLTLELSALQADGQGEVISTPKVMTGDKQEATIKSGTKIPYSTTSANSGTTTTFQDANLELNVTPSITPDGNVQMKLKITKDTVGSLTSAGYVIDTNALQTNVLVNNGETVVLGGIYEDTHQNDVNKVPFLGDLPWIGNLFKTKTTSDSKNELLIFITPRIVDDTVSRNH
ncbi:type IV pilus secretin PilQ family protein [Acinetobacter sp. ANC 4633]|uniref:type IV pilus secretin PilQ n=1 Tax=Acinetobacter sp. ANC 4633 TaxID=2529845 RepID=UPI001038D2A6|nr:type IV pilus secretin PilQ family protein [Acinetobacter sp. ANC 4633]TCB25259.1 type IV pilus secretin PilQ family protein [Acinetobacter sp. ANC 4633]